MRKITPSSDAYIDPVCLMNVDPDKNDIIFTYQMRTYHFCKDACRKAFEVNPEKYLTQKPTKRKGWWDRYLERLNKVTGGKPPKCCH